MTIFWVIYNSVSFVLNCVAPFLGLDGLSMKEDIIGETSRLMRKEKAPRCIMESEIQSTLCAS